MRYMHAHIQALHIHTYVYAYCIAGFCSVQIFPQNKLIAAQNLASGVSYLLAFNLNNLLLFTEEL